MEYRLEPLLKARREASEALKEFEKAVHQEAISDETVRRVRSESPQAIGLMEDIILRHERSGPHPEHELSLVNLELVSDAERWAVERFEEVRAAVEAEQREAGSIAPLGVGGHEEM